MEIFWGSHCHFFGGAKYINRIMDAKTCHTWVYFQKSKDEMAEQLNSWITHLNNNTEDTVKVFFSDNGMEYTGEAMQKIFAKHRVIYKITTQIHLNIMG